MTHWTKARRSAVLRRFFATSSAHSLGAARRTSNRLPHLEAMNETTRTFPGLEPVLTTSQLAAHLGVPVQTIHDLRHGGRGPRGIRVGRELRYRLSEVQNWLGGLEDASAGVATHEGAKR